MTFTARSNGYQSIHHFIISCFIPNAAYTQYYSQYNNQDPFQWISLRLQIIIVGMAG